MSFKAPIFTNKGKQLYASCLAGKNEIIFTNIKLGDGELMAQAIADLEDLVNPIKTIVLNDKKLIGNDQVLIRAVFKNIDIASGFYWREVGLYAQDPENPQDRSKDILFCYQNAGDTAEYIPSASSGLIDKILSMSLVVSDVNSVNVSFFSESYALKEDLDEQIALQTQRLENHKTDANAHSELFAQYVKKSGDTMSGTLFTNQTVGMAKETANSDIVICGGTNPGDGAYIQAYGADSAVTPREIYLCCQLDSDNALRLTNDGLAVWGGKNLVRSVNGVTADAGGNVTIQGCIPDYSSKVDISVTAYTYTAPKKGVLYLGSYSGQVTSITLKINGVLFADYGWGTISQGSGEHRFVAAFILDKGDVVTWNITAYNSHTLNFFPFK